MIVIMCYIPSSSSVSPPYQERARKRDHEPDVERKHKALKPSWNSSNETNMWMKNIMQPWKLRASQNVTIFSCSTGPILHMVKYVLFFLKTVRFSLNNSNKCTMLELCVFSRIIHQNSYMFWSFLNHLQGVFFFPPSVKHTWNVGQ